MILLILFKPQDLIEEAEYDSFEHRLCLKLIRKWNSMIRYVNDEISAATKMKHKIKEEELVEKITQEVEVRYLHLFLNMLFSNNFKYPQMKLLSKVLNERTKSF